MEYPNTYIDKVKEDLWKMWKSAKQMKRTKEKWKPKQTMTKEKWRLQHFDTLGHRGAIAPLTETRDLFLIWKFDLAHQHANDSFWCQLFLLLYYMFTRK